VTVFALGALLPPTALPTALRRWAPACL